MRGMKEAAHTCHAGSSTYARNSQGSTGGRSAGPMREITGGTLPSQAAKDPVTNSATVRLAEPKKELDL